MWKTLNMTVATDYNSDVVYSQQKRTDGELLKNMSVVGRANEWREMQSRKYDDPRHPEFISRD